jgi:hypothetical protein
MDLALDLMVRITWKVNLSNSYNVKFIKLLNNVSVVHIVRKTP